MAETRIARKHFLLSLGAAAVASVAAPVRALTARATAPKADKSIATADLPYKVRPVAKAVARPASDV